MADWVMNINNDLINPEPVVVEEEPDLFITDFLSTSKLQEIAGQSDLETVESLELIVNTTETTVGNFGQYLPSLKQLKLNDSFIPTFRDIGTAFSHLKVLWISRCRLNDVDGIASLRSIQELYISFNNIADLSSISFLDNLEVLDLEANQISEIDQIDYLSIMNNLTTLTLTSNPICQYVNPETKQSFREYVLSHLPNLEYLDDISASISIPASSHSHEDLDIITKAIKVAVDFENNSDSEGVDSSPTNSSKVEISNSKPLLPSTFSLSPLKNFNSTRPLTAAAANRKQLHLKDPKLYKGPKISANPRPGSSGSDSGIMLADDSSSLTFGNPLCGNPIQALKQRRKSPNPSMDFLSHDLNEFSFELDARPSTSLGLRRSLKETGWMENGEGWLDDSERSFSVTSVKSDRFAFSSSTNNQLCSSEEEKTDPCYLKKATEKTNGVRQYKLVSSTMNRQSSTSPFSSPTPPQSPHRPNSAQSFRTSYARRSFSPNAPKSVNVMTVHSVERQCNPSDSQRSALEDRST